MSQVIIVGAGPAGVATAFLLAQRGIQVKLFEQEPTFDRVFRGEGLMPSGVAALTQMGLEDCLAAIPTRALTAWDFYIERQRRMRVLEPPSPLGTRIIHQGALLAAIAERAQAESPCQFYPGWQVTQLQRDGERISGVQAHNGGSPQVFEADLVIAADGRYSRLRKLAGLALTLSPTQFDVLWFKLSVPPALQAETAFTVCLQRQRQFAFYPSWDGRLQIGWIVEKGAMPGSRDRDWIAELAQAAPPWLADYLQQQPTALSGPLFLDVMVGLAPQWSAPGLLLIGDAAHPMAPNRAQGINMALRDAIAIANHLVPLGPQPWSPAQLQATLAAIQATRQPEIEAVQHLQLEEWHKLARLTASPWIYQPFKLMATALGRWGVTQQAWLWQQRGLRQGVMPLQLEV